jgi:hypothetical protein
VNGYEDQTVNWLELMLPGLTGAYDIIAKVNAESTESSMIKCFYN